MNKCLVTSLAVLALIPACQSAGDQLAESTDTTAASDTSASSSSSSGWDGEGSGEGESGGGETTGSTTGAGDSGGDGDSGGEGGDSGDSGDEGDTGGVVPEPGQLTAGEYRDLDDWAFWRDLLLPGEADEGQWGNMMELWSMYPVEQHAFILVDETEAPVIDATASLYDIEGELLWSARSDNQGRVHLFSGLELAPESQARPARASFRLGSTMQTLELEGPAPMQAQVVTMPMVANDPLAADIMFMVDTTGSMSDELEYLKSELSHVVTRVESNLAEAELGHVDLRLSMNFYRDVGDEYVVRAFPFTSDLATATQQLSQQHAAGGGDYPEAVVEAMESGVRDHVWSSNARARLMFLLLDAPPHQGSESNERLAAMTRMAAQQGIRVIPLACSGTDKTTEFVVRFIDVGTGGTYTFLTDDSGIGNPHLEPTVGQYEVEYLDALLERLITDALI